ncbi:hypothetical protein [Arthrobacter sulfonylureivorans]|uniref:Acyl-CoA dehydrogenase C-terminal domain-containing protein n=1 Tax=Arthrobacter sulfonylureivorans TaxID=2486855 RepID=A0ABY3W4W0_9MICC|nr:hypothetical protein [Arthrobacter sulfonylureivorans]UNK45269.1 hypothetical protein MNQ99_15205 [Arthrobacter sulfonylureivorans]
MLAHPEAGYRDHWLAELSAGALVGNAESERTGTFAAQSTRVVEQDDRLLLNGTKYYTTGSTFADWIVVRRRGSGPALSALPRERGSRRWHPARGVSAGAPGQPGRHRVGGTGGDHRLVRSRTRNLFNPAVAPTKDQVSLQIIGEAFGTVETVKAAVLAAARTVQQASTAQQQGTAVVGDFSRADAHVFGIQPIVIDQVLRLISRIFEVGGASATSSSRQLDRLWRNARTISSHNPAIYRQQAVGDYVINGVGPGEALLQLLTAVPAAHGG